MNTDERQKKYTCLLIDDDPWALTDMQNIMPFSAFGVDIIGTKRNAEDAMEMIMTATPDIIISDICLGGMSGLDLIADCRKQGYKGEFIIISGYSDFEYARKAIQYDVSTYLLKPIDVSEARIALQKVCAKLENQSRAFADEQTLIDSIKEYVRKHYVDRLSLNDVAEIFHINSTYLSELFKRSTGKNFVQYKNEVRIEHAKMLLRDTKLPIAQITTECGFDNASYFAMLFRQMTGVSPVQYRNS